MFKGLSNLAAMLRGAQSIGTKLQEVNDQLKARRVTGSAGGGMVEVEMNGTVEALAVRVDPQLFAGGDREMLEDLLVSAINQAVQKAKQMHAELVRSMTGGMELPGLNEALSKLTGGEAPK